MIETPTVVRGDYGDPKTEWATFATLFAKFRLLRGRELFLAQQVNTAITGVFTMWYAPGVTTRMRILYNGEYYGIHSVAEIGRRQGWDITATTWEGEAE